jgi:hypothetical protein
LETDEVNAKMVTALYEGLAPVHLVQGRISKLKSVMIENCGV